MLTNSELYEFIPFYVEEYFEEVNEFKNVNFEDLKNFYFEKKYPGVGKKCQLLTLVNKILNLPAKICFFMSHVNLVFAGKYC